MFVPVQCDVGKEDQVIAMMKIGKGVVIINWWEGG